MSKELPDLPDDLKDVARRLTDARPGFAAAELDRIKLRALAGASRSRRTRGQTKGIAMRSRVLRIVVSLFAFAGASVGGIAALDVMANASTAAYPGAVGSCGIASGKYVINVTGTSTSTAGTAAAIPLTATLEKCSGSPGSLSPVDATSNLTLLVGCTTTGAEPPNAPATCPSTAVYAQTAGGAATNYITLPSGQSAVNFYGGFSAASSPVVVVEGNGVGTAGSATNPYAGYQAETITANASETAPGTYTLTVPAGVPSIGFTLNGAGGGGGSSAYASAAGGAGASISGTINLSSSSSATTFTVIVGGGGGTSSSGTAGSGGTSGTGCAAGGAGGTGNYDGGGGGGGATCIYVTEANPILSVGGGGGGGAYGSDGTGGAGDSTVTNPGSPSSQGAKGGNGASGYVGGSGGSTNTTGSGPYTVSSNTGGAGGTSTHSGDGGATGGTCSLTTGACTAGGAGGGGYNGGGGGGGGEASGGGGGGNSSTTTDAAGGGGGSSFDGGATGYTVTVTSAGTGGAGGASGVAGGAGSVTFTGTDLTVS